MSGIPRYSCHFLFSSAPITNGTTMYPFYFKAKSWYRSIFQALVVTIFRSSSTATSTITHCCLSFRTSVTSGLLCGTRLSVMIVLSHISFTCSFSITGIGWCSYHLSPHSRPYLLLSSQWTLNATLSGRFLYSLCASLGKPLAMCHTLCRCSLHSLHKGESFCLVDVALDWVGPQGLFLRRADQSFCFFLQISITQPFPRFFGSNFFCIPDKHTMQRFVLPVSNLLFVHPEALPCQLSPSPPRQPLASK